MSRLPRNVQAHFDIVHDIVCLSSGLYHTRVFHYLITREMRNLLGDTKCLQADTSTLPEDHKLTFEIPPVFIRLGFDDDTLTSLQITRFGDSVKVGK